MQIDVDDTIAALASAPGAAARGIIRLSGPSVGHVLRDLLRVDAPLLDPRVASRFATTMNLDGLASPLLLSVHFWPTVRSYTGQPTAELHAIGSPVLLEHVLFALQRIGVRAARRGEFTLRAFLSGKIDLAQAEAVLGIIDAPDHAELESALSQLSGGLSGPVVQLRTDLVELLADLEAGLDFVDEDIEFVSRTDVIGRLNTALKTLTELQEACEDRHRSQTRYRVVLAGLPNAGKSTLFNAIVGNEAAIVSPQSGTTRDYLSREIEWNGLAIELIDTAGQEENVPGSIDDAAQTKMREACDGADLVIWCTSSVQTHEVAAADQQGRSQVHQSGGRVLRVLTKCDLTSGSTSMQSADVAVSAATQAGLAELSDAVRTSLGTASASNRHLIGSTAARCRESLAASAESIGVALRAAEYGEGDEFLALEIREALNHLAMILGETYTDDILDRVFSKFCIGK